MTHDPRWGRGIWPGTVVDDKDPAKRGRLRVRVDQAYGAADEEEFIQDAQLPWAEPSFPASGNGDGTLHVPGIGAEVWVAFVGGDSEHPVWLGGWYPTAMVPARLTSSYGPGPQTRLVRTPTGQVLEMRWAAGEEEIIIRGADGSQIRITQASALGGVRIQGETSQGRKWMVDDKALKASLETPTQKVELLDGVPKVVITTPGDVEVGATGQTLQTYGGNYQITSGGAALEQYALASTLTYLLALTITAGAAMALTATGVLTLTGAAIAVLAVSGLVSLGIVGPPKFKLVTDPFITLIQAPNIVIHNANGAKFGGHTHAILSGSSAGQTGGPELPPGTPTTFAAVSPAVPGVHSTVNTEAN